MAYYRTTVLKVGPEAAEMAAAGVLILFAEPVPPALAEMSIVHQPTQTLQGHPISVGDTVTVGAQDVRITAVGEIAANNLEELGHVVLYVNRAARLQMTELTMTPDRVIRERDPDDNRVVRMYLTDGGRELLEKRPALNQKLHGRLNAVLDEEELEELRRMLGALAEAMKE